MTLIFEFQSLVHRLISPSLHPFLLPACFLKPCPKNCLGSFQRKDDRDSHIFDYRNDDTQSCHWESIRKIFPMRYGVLIFEFFFPMMLAVEIFHIRLYQLLQSTSNTFQICLCNFRNFFCLFSFSGFSPMRTVAFWTQRWHFWFSWHPLMFASFALKSNHNQIISGCVLQSIS